MTDEVIGPIILVFTPKPGPPVATGVLICGKAGPSGLFSAWPESLVGEEFGIYIPGDELEKDQWLAPADIAILQGDESGRTFSVVTFAGKLSRTGGSASDAKYHEVAAPPDVSPWDGVKAALANNLDALGKPEGILPHQRLVPKTAAKPKESFLNVAGINPGDFVCRYLLHID